MTFTLFNKRFTRPYKRVYGLALHFMLINYFAHSLALSANKTSAFLFNVFAVHAFKIAEIICIKVFAIRSRSYCIIYRHELAWGWRLDLSFSAFSLSFAHVFFNLLYLNSDMTQRKIRSHIRS